MEAQGSLLTNKYAEGGKAESRECAARAAINSTEGTFCGYAEVNSSAATQNSIAANGSTTTKSTVTAEYSTATNKVCRGYVWKYCGIIGF